MAGLGRSEAVTTADETDDDLYQQFLHESHALERDQDQPGEDVQQEMTSTLNDLMETIEREVQHNRRQRSASDNGIDPTGPSGTVEESELDAGRREPLFVPRRTYLQIFVRNLLLLDYFVVLLLFPFSLYNILRCGFSSVTFSETDFVKDILLYLHYVNDFVSVEGPYRLLEARKDLLSKFHNIIVYYTWPTVRSFIFKYDSSSEIQTKIVTAYQSIVKGWAITVYLIYGIGGTVYLTMAGFFFSICLVITLIRRYKNVQRIVAGSLESSATLPGVF